MGTILDFFLGGPARIKLLLIGVAIGVPVLLATGFAGGWKLNGWRLGAQVAQAEGERDIAVAQGTVLAAGVKACSAGVDLAHKVATQSIDHGKAMLAEARRLHASGKGMEDRIQKLLDQPTPVGAGCEQAWQELYKIYLGDQKPNGRGAQ